MDLIHQREGLPVQAELVLRVHEDEAAAGGNLGAAAEERQRGLLDSAPTAF